MSTILVAVAVVVGLVAVAAVVMPRLVRRGDERRAGPSTGLGDVLPGGRDTTVTTDDGADLHVVEWGEGTPIVFVHGLGLDHRSFHYQYVDLADRHRLIGIDLRGHGRSTFGIGGARAAPVRRRRRHRVRATRRSPTRSSSGTRSVGRSWASSVPTVLI